MASDDALPAVDGTDGTDGTNGTDSTDGTDGTDAPEHGTASQSPLRIAPMETEFKLRVPEGRAAAVLEALATGEARSTVRLAAHYYDTVDDRLACAGLSLRLRHESGRWRQTLKMSGRHGNLQRAEHEVDVGRGGKTRPPRIDLQRHQGTFPGEAAEEALGETNSADGGRPELVERFRTEVVRRSCRLRDQVSEIEVSFDIGRIIAKQAVDPVHELEFELKRGDVEALARVTGLWLRAHGLWLASESKSQRGMRLARNEPDPPAIKADRIRIDAALSPDGFVRAIVAHCMAQILPNVAAIADGSLAEEHVHQARVGLRRARTALRELAILSDELPTQVEKPIAEVFRRLGARRDRQVLQTLRPVLLAAGAKGVAWTEPEAGSTPELAEVVRSASFQCALVTLAGFALGPGRGTPEKRAGLRRAVGSPLRRLHRKIAASGPHFERLPSGEQHEVRKRLKRLRYLSEFVAGLFDAKDVKRYLKRLRPAQEALGDHNDAAVAREFADAAKDQDAKFAVKWLSRAHRKSARKAHRAILRIAGASRFWKRR